MRRGISLFGALGLLALVWSSFAFDANDSASQFTESSQVSDGLKQAERLCIKKQFDQAEQVYLNIIEQAADAEQRFSAQRKLAAVYVAQDKQPLARATVEKILSDYAQHERLPHAIHEITESCHKVGKGIKAKEIYEAILKDQPGHPQKIWLDMGSAIASVLIGDEDAAITVTDRLLNEYRADDRAAEAVGQVAWCYRKIMDFHNARELYRFVVESWPANERAIYSQRGIALTSIALRDANGADAAVEKLFKDYSRHKDFTKAVLDIADEYVKPPEYHKARDLYQHIVDQYPDSQEAIYAQRGVVFCCIALRDNPSTEAGIDKLLRQYSGHPKIADVTYQVARRIDPKNGSKAKELYEYIIRLYPDTDAAASARVAIGGLMLRIGDDKGTRAIFDKALEDYKGRAVLPHLVGLMAEAYWNEASWKEYYRQKSEQKHYIEKALAEWNRIIEQMPEEDELHTAEAYYMSAECCRKLGLPGAIQRYEVLVDRWPENQQAPWALLAIAKNVEGQVRVVGMYPEPEAVAALRKACRDVITYYPDSPVTKIADCTLRQWEWFKAEEGRPQ